MATRSGGLAVPDVQPFYTGAELYALLERYGPAGRRAFLEFSLYDLLYPFVAYGLAALALAALTRSLVAAQPRWGWIVWLPLVGLVVELLEQAGFLGALALFPTRSDLLGSALPVLTRLKFLVITALGILLVALGLLRTLAALRRQREGSR